MDMIWDIQPRPGYLFVDFIEVNIKNEGFGFLLYKEALKYCKQHRFRGLVSGKDHRIDRASRIWDKLKTVGDKYYDYADIKDLGSRIQERLKRGLAENKNTQYTDGCILGTVYGDEIKSTYSKNDYARHSEYDRERADFRWRYYPQLQMLDWWGKPPEHIHQKTKDYLEGLGLIVRITHYLGDIVKEDEIVAESNATPAVILGAILPDGEIKAKSAMSDTARHPFEWSACNKWRYVPDMQFLNFWEEPSSTDQLMVKDFLERHGYAVQYVNVYTARSVHN
jgi:hypothetical protein